MTYAKRKVKLMNTYPGIEDLKKKAQKRIPFVAWEYLQTGTGDEGAMRRNRERLGNITLVPRFMKGKLENDITVQLFGKTYQAPFGVAPVGLTGLMWPKAELILAKMAAKYGIPFTLSTVATQVPEVVGPLTSDMGWFQLYPPRKNELRADLLKRAQDNGFKTLVVTADVPAPSRRERTRRAGLRMPPKITPRFIWQGMRHPFWSLRTLRNGLPRLKTVEAYSQEKNMTAVSNFVRFKFRGDLSWEYIKEVRDLWNGPMILKGLLHPDDAVQAVAIGVDGIGVSNHGGRQFDGAPAAIDVLPKMVETVGSKVAIVFDSGVRSGLDIIRALSLGADFVLLGRAYMYGVAALGKYGADHVTEILMDEMKNNMAQLGVATVEEIKGLSRSKVEF